MPNTGVIITTLIISAFLHILIVPTRADLPPASQSASAVNHPNASESPAQHHQLSSDAYAYLNAHNYFRQQKGVPPLQWDGKLAKYAYDWALMRIDDCNHKHHSNGPYGENTLWEKYDEDTPERVTQVWTDEEKNFDYQKMDCKCNPETPKCMCGHFTQVVWSNTQRIGCANVTCNKELGVLIVCSYDPPGNYVGENPFQKPNYKTNLPPPSAPPSPPRPQASPPPRAPFSASSSPPPPISTPRASPPPPPTTPRASPPPPPITASSPPPPTSTPRASPPPPPTSTPHASPPPPTTASSPPPPTSTPRASPPPPTTTPRASPPPPPTPTPPRPTTPSSARTQGRRQRLHRRPGAQHHRMQRGRGI